MAKKRVIIIGGGFGGLKAALSLKKADIDLFVIDKTNHHLFQPLLYQVATAALPISNIATPIREILHKQKNTTVIMNEVISIDKQNKSIKLLNDEILSYDYLVVATGASPSYFGHDEWKPFLHCLKTLTDAVKIREQILTSFELAENSKNVEEASKHLRFVVIGGGPTGVEMAGAIAEIAHTSIFENFRNINPKSTEIFLIEGSNFILPSYPEKLSLRAKSDLEEMGVKVLTNTLATNITKEGVFTKDQFIATHNIVWAAGNEASSLLKTIGAPIDKQGRILVDADLSLKDFPALFVIGDASGCRGADDEMLPGVAPVAMQQGKYIAEIISKDIPKEKRSPFKYFDKGMMATIGKAKAVVYSGKFAFTGLFAWLMWSFIHVAFLINFRNRFIVMIEWIFLYFTDKRNASTIIRSIDEIEKQPNAFD